MRLICKTSCPYAVYCTNIPEEEMWQLRKIVDKHKCSRYYKVRLLNSKWLDKKIQTNVRENSSLKLTNIMKKTRQKWNVGINKILAYRDNVIPCN